LKIAASSRVFSVARRRFVICVNLGQGLPSALSTPKGPANGPFRTVDSLRPSACVQCPDLSSWYASGQVNAGRPGPWPAKQTLARHDGLRGLAQRAWAHLLQADHGHITHSAFSGSVRIFLSHKSTLGGTTEQRPTTAFHNGSRELNGLGLGDHN